MPAHFACDAAKQGLSLGLELVGEPVDLGSGAADDPQIVHHNGHGHRRKHQVEERHAPKAHEVQEHSEQGSYGGYTGDDVVEIVRAQAPH